MKTKSLGKGLSILLANNEFENSFHDTDNKKKSHMTYTYIDINKLKPGEFQPRKHFDEEKITELANSIKENGIISPLIIRKSYDDQYEIIAGERRWRAAQSINLDKVPVIEKNVSDELALEISILENVQRLDLSPVEEALGYQKLIQEFQYTHEKIAKFIGKSRTYITNLLRILNLPEEVLKLVDTGKLSVGHAKILVTTEDPVPLAKKIVNDKLSVRDLETYLSKNAYKKKYIDNTILDSFDNLGKDQDLISIENSLTEQLGLQVKIENSRKGGRVIVHFNNLEQLDGIIQKLSF